MNGGSCFKKRVVSKSMRELIQQKIDAAKNWWDTLAEEHRFPPIPIMGPSAPREDEGTILEGPRFRQLDWFSCGAVAGWSVIKSIYPDRDRSDYSNFYRDCRTSRENGTSWSGLIKAMRSHGMTVSVRKGALSFAALKREIENGHPLIAVIDVPGKDYLHCVAIYGYKQTAPSQRWIYLNNNREKVMPFQTFQQLQADDNYLVCWGRV